MPNKDLKVIDFDIALKSYEDIKSEAGAVEKESTLENGDIIPGKEIVNGEIKYNDKLYYIYNNILNGEGDTFISEIGVKGLIRLVVCGKIDELIDKIRSGNVENFQVRLLLFDVIPDGFQ